MMNQDVYGLVNFIFVIGVVMAPIIFIGAAFGLIRTLKNDKKDSFEIASSLQNSMYTLMTSMIMGMQRNGIASQQKKTSQDEPSPSIDMSNYESWNERGGFADGSQHYYPQQAPLQLQNSRAATPVLIQSRKGNSGFLTGLLIGLVVFMGLYIMLGI